jgi:NDP-sugar pyrophosphorylase family protein
MIFAAGLGTRLRPLTDTMPKALVPVAGEPLLAHVIRKLVRSGYGRLVVNVHHFPDQIRKYLSENDFGVPIAISDESGRLLETGGAIRHAAPLLSGADRFLVHNVDIISDLDLGWFEGTWREGALATLLVSDRKTSRYLLFDDDLRLVGWTNVSTGEVRSPYPGLDPSACRRLAFAGIHEMSSDILDVMKPFPERFPIIDFYLQVCDRYPVYAALPDRLRLVDVGKFDSLAEAERSASEILQDE